MKTKFFILGVFVALLTACNPDVQLHDYEDTPKVAEHILGMSVQEANKYLESQGFHFGQKADYANEYVYSKDKKFSEFSYDASIMLMFGTFNTDSVYYVDASQRMDTEKNAYDLYWKWSHYTANTTLPKSTYWSGSVNGTYYQTGEQEKFWTDYKQMAESLNHAGEHYRNEGDNVPQKEIEMWVDMNNGGRIELNYETHNFVWIWE